MVRRRRQEEHRNHEAWAIPYGDLVTLLMAFFVVMYAISVVDAGKYRVLSSSLVEAFGTHAPVDPIQVGDPTQAIDLSNEEVRRSLVPVELLSGSASILETPERLMTTLSPTDIAVESLLGATSGEDRERILSEIREMSEEIEQSLEVLIDRGDIQVIRRAYWLELAINTNLLFTSGSATLEPSALPALKEVAAMLAKREVRIHVEGHTDDMPISNSIYPSNWELSSGRAATVVNLFAQNGVDPGEMVALGYAEFQPLASNETEAGRAQNRRVEVIILPDPVLPPASSSEPELLKRDYESGIGQLR